MSPRFSGGPNLAMKVPPHQWEATVAFYREVLALAELEAVDAEPPSVGFAFGAMRLWIDRVAGMSQAELWLEVTTDDPQAAADHLAAAPGVARVDEVEPLAPGSLRFWISSPAQIVHLVGPTTTVPRRAVTPAGRPPRSVRSPSSTRGASRP